MNKREFAKLGMYEIWCNGNLYQWGQTWEEAQSLAAYLRRNGNMVDIVQQTVAR